jgi:hypothetical protein
MNSSFIKRTNSYFEVGALDIIPLFYKSKSQDLRKFSYHCYRTRWNVIFKMRFMAYKSCQSSVDSLLNITELGSCNKISDNAHFLFKFLWSSLFI